ncbi:bacterioferritin [Hydrogenispora ethanolica]|jgi:bacterioferritin|uniref:Bacterioferritin n=1 Tax=Hydrogenispora ethanolica TaxID=1082276 RepID=A0A4R1RQA9_HYDET|nr:ferritin-like domain-containing protein [Hydrogenispora ethanolica]TCL68575.1 bacterioferritin [Hydrogenispora ethanolica]
MAEPSDPHLRNRICDLPEPYPAPEAMAPNHYYATLLLEDFTGAISEMTAINQYLYHHFTFHGRFPELAELVECISIIEMKHMELLAEAILSLGKAPEFRTLTANAPAYWNAAVVYYGTGLADRLSADIAAEIQAIQLYRHHQQLIADQRIQALLERIIRDEQHHLGLFRQAYAKYCP